MMNAHSQTPQERLQMLVSMADAGQSDDAIAFAMGVERSTVANTRLCLGIPSGWKKSINGLWTEAEEQEIEQLRRAGHTFKEIAMKTGRSFPSVYKKLRRISNDSENTRRKVTLAALPQCGVMT